MIDTFVRVLDRLIQLLTVRAKRRGRLFDELWEPTFSDLRAVHGDYLRMFETCAAKLAQVTGESGEAELRSGLDGIAQELRRRRLEFEPVRRQLIALVDRSESLDLDDTARSFVDALLWYFPTGTNRQLPTKASETLARLEALILSVDNEQTAAGLEQGALDDLRKYVAEVVQYQRDAWDRVCEAYAVLRARNAQEAGA